MEEFKCEIPINDLDHLNREYKPVEIRWRLEIEMRTWGVKSICIFVPDQEINLVYQEEVPDNDKWEDREEVLKLEKIDTNTDCEIEDIQYMSICPQELELCNGIWTVKF